MCRAKSFHKYIVTPLFSAAC